MSPVTRLVLRALITGLIASLAVVKASIGDGFTGTEIVDIVGAFVVGSGALSLLEVTTPINATVGINKTP